MPVEVPLCIEADDEVGCRNLERADDGGERELDKLAGVQNHDVTGCGEAECLEPVRGRDRREALRE